MLGLGCRCQGYRPKPPQSQTFICPADRQVYPLTNRNKRKCEKLMSNMKDKIKARKGDKNVSYGRKDNPTLRIGRY
jgi:hypothetical protein